jgi:hypothetical protein
MMESVLSADSDYKEVDQANARPYDTIWGQPAAGQIASVYRVDL